ALFDRAILQSPPPSLVPLSTVEADARARRFLELLGIDPAAPDAAERLRAEDAADLATVQMALARELAQFAEITPAFVPVVEGLQTEAAFIEAAANAAAESGTAIVAGTTREEMHAFLVPDPAMEHPDPRAVAERFATLAGGEEVIDEFRLRRPAACMRDLLADLVTDYRFHLPCLRLLESIAARGGRAWAYQFDWAPPRSRFRACHCIELPFTFGSFGAWDAPMLEGGDAAEMAALSATIRASWVGFVRHGTPELGRLRWPKYRADRRWTMQYGQVIGAVGDPAGISLGGRYGIHAAAGTGAESADRSDGGAG
ncbi:MAG: carboxylesterase family protein, partial [Acetobacteraceae bacterium]